MSMNTTVAVVGPGAIGTTVAASLHEVGRTPALYGRTSRDWLELRVNGDSVVIPGPVETEPARATGPADLVFLAVKSTQVEAAAPWLATLCGPDTVVCVLQNGVEQVSLVSPFANGAAVLPAVVWFPAEAQPDGSVLLRGEPRLTLPDLPQSRAVVDALHGSRCSIELVADFRSVAWRKLL